MSKCYSDRFKYFRVGLVCNHSGKSVETFVRKGSVWHTELAEKICPQLSFSWRGTDAEAFCCFQNLRSGSEMKNHDGFPGRVIIRFVQCKLNQLLS